METIIVILIIALTVFLVFRSFYRSVTQKQPACVCANKECAQVRLCDKGFQ